MVKFLKRAYRELAMLCCPYRVGVVTHDRKVKAVYAAVDYREAIEWVNLNRPISVRYVIQRLDFFGNVQAEQWGSV